nr:MAG TPA: hypothetical protein [Caudoviricetes sp.]
MIKKESKRSQVHFKGVKRCIGNLVKSSNLRH